MNILVNGIGNIGSTLLSLLVEYKNQLSIDSIYAHKRKIHKWQENEIKDLEQKGVQICTSSDDVYLPFKSVLEEVNYIFEGTPNGVGLQNKAEYEKLKKLIGASAQGSEKGFGCSFMSDVNNEKIRNEKFVHIVSCNTHGSAAILKLFSGKELKDLSSADMVVVRRSEDLGNHQRLVSANVVARHLNTRAGTHHSIDVIDLFKTLNISCDLTSSDITTPSQLMHAVRFNIELKQKIDQTELKNRIENQALLARTDKFDSNVIFELGRRKGFNGRIYSHAIIVENNILFSENKVKGWAFIPQEGNTIISTLHAFLLQTNHPDEEKIIERLKSDLCFNQW